ncbi:hypothetical protein NEFER03_0060 [Nematocida sp. LUAm3]|nr:hypothetical protein NEFER03_0060 [Nematocida sp. LUAm3]KAI5173513.1 hypothetical protein NEFER02_0029 [Nematocida sp. LUAm2]KAI5176734.1 hypothetical protein NEFER01_0059 [Nematocida sp. LUAm1]
MEKEQKQRRAEYLEELQKESRKKERAYERKLAIDKVRSAYSSLWLQKRTYKEKMLPEKQKEEETQSIYKDVFFVSSSTPRNIPCSDAIKDEKQKNLHENTKHIRGEEDVQQKGRFKGNLKGDGGEAP